MSERGCDRGCKSYHAGCDYPDCVTPAPAVSADTPEEICPGCGVDAGLNWFDRSLCPEPCGAMHTRCSACGVALDTCPLDAAPAVSADTPEDELAATREALRMLRDAWNHHMTVCERAESSPSFEQINEWMRAPSSTASAFDPLDETWHFAMKCPPAVSADTRLIEAAKIHKTTCADDSCAICDALAAVRGGEPA